jgi:hypothetical protein
MLFEEPLRGAAEPIARQVGRNASARIRLILWPLRTGSIIGKRRLLRIKPTKNFQNDFPIFIFCFVSLMVILGFSQHSADYLRFSG